MNLRTTMCDFHPAKWTLCRLCRLILQSLVSSIIRQLQNAILYRQNRVLSNSFQNKTRQINVIEYKNQNISITFPDFTLPYLECTKLQAGQ